ncbi:EAL domain-containing protein [Egicoccus halophilus]|uniref:EAL domain-containing protein n=1 Tax=Egicoccus halophilus TaxID=1670830 RepID=UPI0013EED8C9|nr:EAL domain-containing protein [Egicoccus halophilus]
MRAATTADPAAVPVPRALRGAVAATLRRWRESTGTDVEPDASSLADALADGLVSVGYQPVVELATGRPVAVEALVRLDDPPSPALADATGIVAVAERSGLVPALGAHVLVQACCQLAAWRRESALASLRLHVNVSPLQLGGGEVVDLVRRALAATALPADALVVEVTETAAFSPLDAGHQDLHTLAGLGVGIALDDFGTGFATLDLLASAPFTMLKLDHSFVAAVGTQAGPARGRALVVQAAIGLGTSLGLQVVAEGIERHEQVVRLREWGCELGQGFHYADAGDGETVRAFSRAAAERPLPPAPPRLSGPALDLATAAATVVVAGDPRPGSLRADALEAARVVGSALSLPQDRIDRVALLAPLIGTGDLLQVLRTVHAAPAWLELEAGLAHAPALDPGAHPGAVAAAVARLVVARRIDRALDDTLDDLLGDADRGERQRLVDRLSAWWHGGAVSAPPAPALAELAQRLRGRDDAAARLRGLVGVAQAIGTPGDLLDVLEVAADAARATLGAATVTVSRWERDAGQLRLLVNAGEIAAGIERRPAGAVHDLDDVPGTRRMLLERGVLLIATDDPSTSDRASALLRHWGRGSAIGVPIVVDGAVWGALLATTALAEAPFTAADVGYADAVAGFVGLAISRTDHLDHLARLAGEDAMTRLANRRRFEAHAGELLAASTDTTPVTVVMLDVNGLKEVNDVFGHAAGDELLITVGEVLSRVAIPHADALAARLGGDEFCLVLPGNAELALELVSRLLTMLADAPGQPRAAIGVATSTPEDRSLSALLARADTAQYRAKTSGVAVVLDDGRPAPTARRTEPFPARSVRPGRERPGRAVETSLARWSRGVDGAPDPREALSSLGEAVLSLVDGNRWTLSRALPGSSVLSTAARHLRRRRPLASFDPPQDDDEFRIEDYPVTAAAFDDGQGFAVEVDDPAADPDERAILDAEGFRWVVAVTQTDAAGTRWLLECYGDDESRPTAEVVPLVEALASRTLGHPVRCVR